MSAPTSGTELSKDSLRLWLLIGFLTAIRLVAAARVGLAEDEMYYRLWSLFPTYGYLDHPPMVAWWIAAGRWIAGDNALGIRLFSVLAVIVGTLAMRRTAWLLTGSRALALRSAIWLQAVPLVGVGAIIMTPDSPSVMFWALALWAAAELDHSKNPRWLIAMGIFAGLGLESKYSGLFFGAGFVLWISTDPASRRWWRSPELYLGGVMAILIAAPVIYWNAQHHWASFEKQFGRVAATRFSPRYLGEFISVAFGLLFPLIAIFAIIAVVDLLRRKSRSPRAVWFLLAYTLPFSIYLFIHSFHDRVQANWPAPLFPGLCLLAVIGSDSCEKDRARRALRTLVPYTAPIGIGLSLLIMLLAILPMGVLPLKLDITKRIRGWDTLSQAVAREQLKNGATWIATDSYVMTGTLSYELRATQAASPVVPLCERLRYDSLPTPPPSLLKSPGLYVTLSRSDRSEQLKEFFSDVIPMGSIDRVVRDKTFGTYRLYLLGKPKDPELTADFISERISGR